MDHKDKIHVPAELFFHPILVLPLLLLKAIWKTFPDLFGYKSITYWVPRVVLASVLSYIAVHLLRAGLMRFGISLP
jgi:hypothetical protein